jgi:hypothetical protein
MNPNSKSQSMPSLLEGFSLPREMSVWFFNMYKNTHKFDL